MEIGSIFEIDVEDLFKEGNNEFYLPFMDKRDYIYNKFSTLEEALLSIY